MANRRETGTVAVRPENGDRLRERFRHWSSSSAELHLASHTTCTADSRADCGAAATAVIAAITRKLIIFRDIARACGTSHGYFGAKALPGGVGCSRLRGRTVSLEIDAREMLINPGAILFWEFRHFVVFERADSRRDRPLAGKEEATQFRSGVGGNYRRWLLFEPAGTLEQGKRRRSRIWPTSPADNWHTVGCCC